MSWDANAKGPTGQLTESSGTGAGRVIEVEGHGVTEGVVRGNHWRHRAWLLYDVARVVSKTKADGGRQGSLIAAARNVLGVGIGFDPRRTADRREWKGAELLERVSGASCSADWATILFQGRNPITVASSAALPNLSLGHDDL
ncbi:hypothetical protein VTI74DRAFT_8360 [Chaetomium olivicolor]